jgi:hypothetical protein
MDTFIYSELSFQILPQMINILVDVPFNWRTIERISSYVYRLFGRYSFQTSLCDVYVTCLSINH